jgi:O-antigen/teichoic acid export membrane protein
LLKSSVKSRFIITVFVNFLRSALSFATGLIIARNLGPGSYGDYSFLLASFVAVNKVLEMGTSNAFYTFMSQKPRSKKFVGSYVAWQFLQFVVPLTIIGLFFPNTWINLIWLGQQRELILLAFAAVFMQQQAWQTMVQIGESMRLTFRVQIMNLCLAMAHIILVTAMWQLDFLSAKYLFGLITTEYVIIILISCKVIPLIQLSNDPLNGKALFKEYRTYCTPLILYSLLGFIHDFADRWLLQNFGGSKEQGFYSIGYQFSVISLLATGSMLNIFWKEIAEAHESEDRERMLHLYQKVCRFLYFSTAATSAFLIPWSEEITRITLGPTFVEGHMVIAVMFFYAAHRALFMVNGSMLLATGQTRFHFISGGIFMILSIPTSYFIQAPTSAAIPGLGWGAMGMAIKVTIFSIIMVNIVTWWIGRQYEKSFNWTYQIVGMGGALTLGWLAFSLVKQLAAGLSLGLYLQVGAACLLYFPMIVALLWQFPWIAGTSREEMRSILIRAKILRKAPFGE